MTIRTIVVVDSNVYADDLTSFDYLLLACDERKNVTITLNIWYDKWDEIYTQK